MSNSVADKTFALFANPGVVKIIAQLENAGANLIKFPPPEAEKVEPNEISKEILNRLVNFDWIIFPDVLAVDFFLGILEEKEIDFFDLDEMRVCALGEAVSDRLRFVQLHADVIPDTLEAENVLSALKNYIAEDGFENLKFLLPVEISLQNPIEDGLLKMNAEVCRLPVYQIKFSGKDKISKLKALLKGGAIDEFIFSAPTDFIALNHIFNGEPLVRILSEVAISAADGLIFQTVREHDLKRAGLFRLDKLGKV